MQINYRVKIGNKYVAKLPTSEIIKTGKRYTLTENPNCMFNSPLMAKDAAGYFRGCKAEIEEIGGNEDTEQEFYN